MKTPEVEVYEVIALVLTAFVFQFLGFHGWFASGEGKVIDAVLTAGKTKPGDVIVVDIDQQAYQECFGAQSPLEPSTVIMIAKAIAETQPAAIGFDVLTESPKYRDLRDIPPEVVWIGGFDEQRPLREVGYFKWLLGATEELQGIPLPVLGQERPASVHWGMPAILLDEDREVRRVARKFWLSDSLDRYPSGSQSHFAMAVADSFCAKKGCTVLRDGSNTYLRYSKTPARIPLQKIWNCSSKAPAEFWPFFEHEAQDKVVLVGGTYRAARDEYPTPLGDLPGVMINAYAIQSEIDGNVLHELIRPVALFFDLLIGIGIVLVSAMLHGKPVKLLVSTCLILVCAGIFSVKVLGPLYLSGMVGSVLGVLTESFFQPLSKLFGFLGKMTFRWKR